MYHSLGILLGASVFAFLGILGKMSDTSHTHDDMLFEMLRECKTLPNFLDEIFGFLQRRTDFYHIANEPNAAVGLPEGLAEKVVRHTFYKWKSESLGSIYSETDIPTDAKEVVLSECVEVSEVTSTTRDMSIDENKQDFCFNKSEYYNGSVFTNYCWSQTIVEIHITVKVPEIVTTKDLNINITPSKISVKLKDGTVLLEGDLCKKCKANEAIWSLSGRKLEIHLDKCQDIWWNCLVKTDPEVNISDIDCTRPYEDLPEEAQAKIEELQWNQERKRLGLPTSEEMKLQEKLKKAWNADGSPFTGPFDPSAILLE